MQAVAHHPETELARKNGNGRRQRQGSAASTTRPADADRPYSPAPATADGYRRLGADHHRRDDAARRAARALQERTEQRALACARRWPAILQAMRTLIGWYNEGAGREMLVLVDSPAGSAGEPSATITAPGGQTLVIAVEGADLRVHAGLEGENRRQQGERWIDLNRTDDATAGYVLQNWLAQLSAGSSNDCAAPR